MPGFDITVSIDGTDVRVTGHYTPPQKARTYGPPEDCYPAYDAEVDIDSAIVTADEHQVDLWALPKFALADNIDELIATAVEEEMDERARDAEFQAIDDALAAREAEREYA